MGCWGGVCMGVQHRCTRVCNMLGGRMGCLGCVHGCATQWGGAWAAGGVCNMLGCAWVCKVLGRARVARVCMSCSGCTWGCTGCWGCAQAARGGTPTCTGCSGCTPACAQAAGHPHVQALPRAHAAVPELQTGGGGCAPTGATRGPVPVPDPRPRVPRAPCATSCASTWGPGPAACAWRCRSPAASPSCTRSFGATVSTPCTPPWCHRAPTPVTFLCVPPLPGSPRPVQAQRGAPGPEQPERAGARGRDLRHRGLRAGAGAAAPRPGWQRRAPRRAHPQGDGEGDGHRDPPPC